MRRFSVRRFFVRTRARILTASLALVALAGPARAEPGALPPPTLVRLAVPGFGDAVVSEPAPAKGPLPLLLATHGNYDRPEWQCEVWREIVLHSAFVLCPRGVARPDSPSARDIRFTYSSNARLEKEIAAGLAALREKYPARIDDGPIVYTGFSLGAIMGVSIMARQPERYRRAVLIEGGFRQWTPRLARQMGGVGDARVLFGCGGGGCMAASRRAVALLEKHGGPKGAVVGGGNAGHTYDGPVARAVKERFAWLIEGDPRWAR